MVKVVFVHGWGFTPAFWQDVIKKLDCQATFCLDLGFFGPDKTDVESKDCVFVTHSMGLPWLLNYVTDDYKGLIAINGFTKFCRDDDWPSGIDSRILTRMIRQFQKNPKQVWSDFMLKSGMENATYLDTANEERLLEGLQQLQDWDVRKRYEALTCPTLVIAAGEDEIVPRSLSSDCFGQDIDWYEQADHLLPLSDPVTIAAKIRSFLEKIS